MCSDRDDNINRVKFSHASDRWPSREGRALGVRGRAAGYYGNRPPPRGEPWGTAHTWLLGWLLWQWQSPNRAEYMVMYTSRQPPYGVCPCSDGDLLAPSKHRIAPAAA
jgi:hypothetical protein